MQFPCLAHLLAPKSKVFVLGVLVFLAECNFIVCVPTMSLLSTETNGICAGVIFTAWFFSAQMCSEGIMNVWQNPGMGYQ